MDLLTFLNVITMPPLGLDAHLDLDQSCSKACPAPFDELPYRSNLRIFGKSIVNELDNYLN